MSAFITDTVAILMCCLMLVVAVWRICWWSVWETLKKKGHTRTHSPHSTPLRSRLFSRPPVTGGFVLRTRCTWLPDRNTLGQDTSNLNMATQRWEEREYDTLWDRSCNATETIFHYTIYNKTYILRKYLSGPFKQMKKENTNAWKACLSFSQYGCHICACNLKCFP